MSRKRQWNGDDGDGAIAKAMWGVGTSAKTIGAHFGITRNTAIGRLRRMGAVTPVKSGHQGLETPRKSRKQKRPAFVIQHSEPTMPRALPPTEPSTATAVTTFALAPGQCKWPLNDGAPKWLHCGAPAECGPYCEFHRRKSEGVGTRKEVAA